MTDRKPRSASAKTTIGDQRTGLAQPLGLEIARGVEHLLHAWPAPRSLIANHNHVPGLDLVGQNRVAGRFLRFVDLDRALEDPDRLIHPGRLHDTAVDREIARENRQPPIHRMRVGNLADAACFAVEIRRVEILVLGKSHNRANPARSRKGSLHGPFGGVLTADILGLDGLAKGRGMHRGHVDVQLAGAVESTENRKNAPGMPYVLNVVTRRRCHLADARGLPRNSIDVAHTEINAGFVGCGQKMEHGVRRPPHGDIQRHRILEG